MNEFFDSNGFSIAKYPDGLYWTWESGETLVQVKDGEEVGSSMIGGWVENNLTVQEMQCIINNGTLSGLEI